MQTQTISEDQWVDYFDRFSRDHLGWPATIQVLHREYGPQHLADHLPLQGISFDTAGSRPSSIEIIAGDPSGQSVLHIIDLPLRIQQSLEDDGSVDVQIEPAKGPVTLVHLSK